MAELSHFGKEKPISGGLYSGEKNTVLHNNPLRSNSYNFIDFI